MLAFDSIRIGIIKDIERRLQAPGNFADMVQIKDGNRSMPEGTLTNHPLIHTSMTKLVPISVWGIYIHRQSSCDDRTTKMSKRALSTIDTNRIYFFAFFGGGGK
jgi:hypothetical protein